MEKNVKPNLGYSLPDFHMYLTGKQVRKICLARPTLLGVSVYELLPIYKNSLWLYLKKKEKKCTSLKSTPWGCSCNHTSMPK